MTRTPTDPSETRQALQRLAARTLVWIVVTVGSAAALIGGTETLAGLRHGWASQRLLVGLALLAVGGVAALAYRAGRPRVATTIVLAGTMVSLVAHAAHTGLGVHTLILAAGGLLIALGAAAGGWSWIGGDLPAAARQAIERGRAAVTHAWAASQAPVQPGPGRRDPAAPSAAPGGTSDPASAVASAAAAAAARPRATGAAAERPSGDLRHCLDRGQGADVARCAEGQ